ncbi:MAG: 4Fe-4S dicluster domain-containing protein [Lachnospiraceae bacterium]
MNINKEMITDISGVNPRKCMKCGKCSANCPAFDAMDYHPHQFVDMVENGRIEALMQSKSIWNCLSCMACVQRCPEALNWKVVETTRLAVIRQQGMNHLSEEQFQSCLIQSFRSRQLSAHSASIRDKEGWFTYAENRYLYVGAEAISQQLSMLRLWLKP